MLTKIRGSTQIQDATILNAQIAAAAGITTSKLADGANFFWRDGSVVATADWDLGTNQITNMGDPIDPQDAATRAWVLAQIAGFSTSAATVRAATTANITLSGTQTVDGVSLSVGDKILVKNQSTGANNGLYTVAAGAWTRAANADSWNEIVGQIISVEEGTTNADTLWLSTADLGGALGSTSITYIQLPGPSDILAGDGLVRTGQTMDVVGTANRIVVSANAVDIGTDVVTLTGAQTLTNKSIVATQLTGTLQAAQFPALTGDVTTTAGSLATTIANNVVTLDKLATLAANSVIGNSTGSIATPTAVPMLATATASSVALRNAAANLSANNFISGFGSILAAAGTTTLLSDTVHFIHVTGVTTHTIVLPAANTLVIGHSFFIANRSSGIVTVNANGGGLIQSMAAGSQMLVTVVTVATSAGTWDAAYSLTGAGSGTVTTVSVVSTNGFTGSVATATTTPAITISTTVTGLLKGNGTAISAANVGADYVNNSSFVIREIPTGSINGSNVVFTTANTVTSGTEQVFHNGNLLQGGGEDYTFSSTNTITFVAAPLTDDRVLVSYMK